MDSFYRSSSPDQLFYEAEIEKGGCITEKNTGLTYDPRFVASGLHTSLLDVQKASSVIDRLENLPHYSSSGPP